MDITIKISEKAERIISQRAKESGRDISQFVGEFLERSFTNGQTNGNEQPELKKNKTERRFMRMKGMFSGGDGKSAERLKEIMLSEIDSVEGLSKR